MTKISNNNHFGLAMVYSRKNGHNLRNAKHDFFIMNLIIKFYNAFAIHKATGKQAIITKILPTGIFGVFLKNRKTTSSSNTRR